jgi:hypothetical protein
LLLFVVPSAAILFWFIPEEGLEFSRRAFGWSVGVLFPLGGLLDFFFARYFFTYPNASATLGIKAPALGQPVPVEEYGFYLFGFATVLLLYIWLDEYWLSAYTVRALSKERMTFDRLLRFHPASLILVSWLLCVSRALRVHSLNGAAPGGTPGDQLACAEPHDVYDAGDEPAVGGDAGAAVWVVELSSGADARIAHYRMVDASD